MLRIEKTEIDRRKVLATLVAGGLMTVPTWANAATYPARPLKNISSSAGGAMGDLLARTLGQNLSEIIGQPFVVENRPGAGGHIAGEAVARSNPDGYTVFIAGASFFALAPILFPTLAYAPEKDLVPVGYVSDAMHLILTNRQIEAKSFEEFMEYAKRKGPDVNFGSAGIGHPLHLYIEQIQKRFGTKMTHIPYGGSPAALQALAANDIQFLVSGVPDAASYSKQLKILAFTGPQVDGIVPASTPNLNTLYPDLAYSGWTAMWMPKKTPPEIVESLAKSLDKLMNSSAYRKGLEAIGNVPMRGGASDVNRQLAADIQTMRAIAREINIKS
ncbi:tripartite tricarboxylate transporter substrate binding protein [Diaphorobacter sp. HDW4A]|uniref:Bug family tripartite tricarboxylate transporter substrate binding protein n=1 Tax=Diaphorobacter sp. HDW4A TaxID=2714924 RepID=UPI001407FE9D|nr:tripartite tricarboxylate transporter substrate binding protein [Diaphorobacter sp. HDW4A]QIL79417.1 tripartite tricarboxylate transporter substrate binding protein [Diaphorobacter sp. HDW4A]